ncbi:histidine kinase [Pseudoclavibacter sp. 13-3]|uniref:histidine kinase n=1 Tax=Pseudoclavibacter sp. 13-3 TaxID=2901228 RepID=UPI001E431FCF|nr:histidine kinase [Pseudoclavibacter sp. 13-3]MCD7100749.1 histidine kinase [Pseudoclavibacter sp. 13-3]
MTRPDTSARRPQSGQEAAASTTSATPQTSSPDRKSTLSPTAAPQTSFATAPKWPLAFVGAGGLVILITYFAVLLTQPATLGQDLGDTTLWVMLGYLAGAALIVAGTVPLIPRRVYGMIPVAIALNVVIGQVVGTMTPVPLYLDSIGTVIVGVLAGPAAGALTGVLSNLIWGVTLGPSVIPFTAGAAFVGAAAGWAARLGAFRHLWSAIIAGAVIGIPTGAIAAPVAAYVYGGGLGVGTGGLVATLQAAGLEMLNATTVQSLISDTADKAIVFVLACVLLRTLPQRVLRRYPFTRWSLPKSAAAASADR